MKYSSYLFFLFIVLIFFCFRVLFWNWVDLDLSFDEAQYYSWSNSLAWGYYSKPPILAWIIKISTMVCGNSELCIRISSPFMHSLTAFFIGLAAYNYSLRVNKSIIFIAAIIWLLMPGVSLSSGFISTDVPLLFFTSLILWLSSLIFTNKESNRNNLYIFVMSIFLALGFLSKYALIYIFIAIFFALIFEKSIRNKFLEIFVLKNIFLIFLTFFILITPHLIWNIDNGFITAQHTISNTNLGGHWNGFKSLFKFFIEQFVVFGPITFSLLLFVLFRYKYLSVYERYLIFLTFTPIIIILVQAFISRAHANWAAIAYVSGTILIAIYFMKIWNNWGKKLFYFNMIIGFLFMILIPLSGFYNMGIDPFKKNRGWSELGQAISNIHAQYPNSVLVADDRRVLAEALYYMKIKPKKWVRWNADGIIHDHYELVTNHEELSYEIGLMISSEKENKHFKTSFESVIFLEDIIRPIGIQHTKKYKVWLLRGYKN